MAYRNESQVDKAVGLVFVLALAGMLGMAFYHWLVVYFDHLWSILTATGG